MSLVIKNGTVIDPAANVHGIMDVVIDGAAVSAVGKNLAADEAIDATGLLVCPGLVDLHVHFREPGFESKETIASGSLAAARGGYTTVVTMPVTNPVIDNAGMVEFVHRRARETACIRVKPAACATKGMAGEEMTEMAELKEVGAVAVGDNATDITSGWVLRRVLEYATMCGLPYLAHCEDDSLADNGAMNEGLNSTRLGIPGLPTAMEESRIDRNIRIAELAGAAIHIQQVTTKGGVELIRRAKERGQAVTAEVSPHHLLLTDDAIGRFNTNAKLKPPLRTEADVAALREAVADGAIDCIATGHAPHTFTDKDVEFALAPFGVVGLETALGLVLTDLVGPGVISLDRAIDLLSTSPARILGLDAGTLAVGAPADMVLIDPNTEWKVTPAQFASKGRNTPFAGKPLTGQVHTTLCDGRVVYKRS